MENNCSVTPKPKTIKEFFRSWYFWKPFLGIVIGGLAGFLYFYFVGCKSGSCPITSSAYGTIITGSLLGFFVTSGPCGSCK
jgi:hypothetical protein